MLRNQTQKFLRKHKTNVFPMFLQVSGLEPYWKRVVWTEKEVHMDNPETIKELKNVLHGLECL